MNADTARAIDAVLDDVNLRWSDSGRYLVGSFDGDDVTVWCAHAEERRARWCADRYRKVIRGRAAMQPCGGRYA